MLTTTCKEESDWDKEIGRIPGRIQWSVNNTFNKATQCTPFMLMFGFIPRTYDGDNVNDALKGNVEDMKLRTKALEAIISEQKWTQGYHKNKQVKLPQYVVEDLVMVLRQIAGQQGESKKLLPKYKGPYVVTEVLPKDRYRVQDVPEAQRTQKFYERIAAIDQMKLYEDTNYSS